MCLTVVDRGEGGAIDDRGWSGVDDPLFDIVLFADVQGIDISTLVFELSILTCRRDGPSELTVCTGDEDSTRHGVDGNREE